MNAQELYCASLFAYQRNVTCPTKVGNIGIGGLNPIRVQSMTTTATGDTEASVAQCITLINAGAELVRLTAQGRREAKNLESIQKELTRLGYHVPLVADIHFNPQAAEIAAACVEKVRINPGNFAGGAKKFDLESPPDEALAIAEIRSRLIPLLQVCRNHGTALRIGVNHGSLSDRIMALYGDTPAGMVASCMEYLRICCELDFHQIVLSIKASNTRVMVHTVRLLVRSMRLEGMNYPLHLGVTEAGSDEEGRIKSAVGTGALLADGLGDTIRVSLTERPENEIPVARILVNHMQRRMGHAPVSPCDASAYSPYVYQKRATRNVLGIGGNSVPVVVADSRVADCAANLSDWSYVAAAGASGRQMMDYGRWIEAGKPSEISPLLSLEEFVSHPEENAFVSVYYDELVPGLISPLKSVSGVVLVARARTQNPTAECRAMALWLQQHGIEWPLIVWLEYREANLETFQVESAADSGLLFLDGLADGLLLSNEALLHPDQVVATQFAILQAARVRFTKTDFISCPGCGRTLFDLQETTREIKVRTGHLKGLKIGIMGCIVNGIGEMADADYGYIGAGPGKISLFRNRELVQKNLDASEAVDALIELIRADGKWSDAQG